MPFPEVTWGCFARWRLPRGETSLPTRPRDWLSIGAPIVPSARFTSGWLQPRSLRPTRGQRGRHEQHGRHGQLWGDTRERPRRPRWARLGAVRRQLDEADEEVVDLLHDRFEALEVHRLGDV